MNKNSRPWTVSQISKMIENGTLVCDNAVQRNFVWDKKRMSLLIDSLLRDYPVPAFYAITDGRKVVTPKGEVSVYDLLDGKQRVTTVNAFYHNEFALTHLDPFMTDEGEVDISGKTFEELPEELQDSFKNSRFNVCSFDDATEEDIVEIMSRLNNGKPLSAIDNTRIKAKDLPGIKRLAEHKLFKTFFTEKAINNHQTEEIVIKAYMHVTNPETALENKQVRPVYESLVITDEVNEMLTNLFDTTADIALILSQTKKVFNKFIKKTHLISSFYLIDKMMKEGISVEQMAGCLKSFFEEGNPSYDEDYNAACKNGSNHEANVIARRTALDTHYDWYFNHEDETEEDSEDRSEDDAEIFETTEENNTEE